MNESNPNCIGYPPEPEPTESENNSRKVFDSLIDKRMFNPKVIEEFYTGLMAHTIGFHMRLVGAFWGVGGINNTFNRFYEFVIVHAIRVKVTWEPRHAGGWDGVQFFGAELKDFQPDLKEEMTTRTTKQNSDELVNA